MKSLTEEYDTLDYALQHTPYSEDPSHTLRVSYTGRHLDLIAETLHRVVENENIEFHTVAGFPEKPGTTGVTKGRAGRRVQMTISTHFMGRPFPRVAQLYTLLHELAHHFTPDSWKTYALGRAANEVIAETAAYIVGARLGFEGLPRSADYVKNWSYQEIDHRELKQHSLLVAERLWEAFQMAVDEQQVAA